MKAKNQGYSLITSYESRYDYCQTQFQLQFLSNLIELSKSNYQCQATHPTHPGTLLPVHSGSRNLVCKLILQI